MTACPQRGDFFLKLAADPKGGPPVPQSQLSEDLDKWLAALDVIVKRIEAFYEKGGFAK
jgi:hypothetical protein